MGPPLHLPYPIKLESFVGAGIFSVLGFLLLRREESSGGVFVNLTAMVWLFYGVYEYLLKTTFGVTPGSSYFRCDAVVTFPVLAIMTLVSLIYIYTGLCTKR